MTYFNKQISPYIFPFLWLILTALFQILGKPLFRYESSIISSLELWRLFTAHWVHINWIHWLMNNLGLIILVAITRVQWRISFWLKLIMIHSLFISLALLIFNPQLNWYVGFSGVLYGLYVVAAMLNLKKDKLMSLIIIAIVFVKIGAEQIIGSDMSTQAILGAPVIVDAHAYGVICGLSMALLLLTKLIKIKT